MKKLLFIVSFLCASFVSFSQYSPNPGNYGTQLNRLLPLKVLHVPIKDSTTIDDTVDSAQIFIDKRDSSLTYRYAGNFYKAKGGQSVNTDSIWNAINARLLKADTAFMLSKYVRFTQLDSAVATAGFLIGPISNSQLQHSAIFFSSTNLIFSGGGTVALGGTMVANADTVNQIASIKRLKDSAAALRAAISSGGGGTVTSVTSANSDASISNTTTTPVITINTGSGANQIVKRDGSGNLNATTVTTNANLTGDVISTGNITSYNQTVPVSKGGTGVNSITGLIMGNGSSGFSAATPGVDYLTPTGSAAGLTSFPILNQNTTGSAATLTTPRAINGVNFDGSAPITVTAAAGTLTGTTLNSTVVTSSLTSVGTLTNLTVTNPIAGSVAGNSATVTTNANLNGDIISTGNTTTYNNIVPINKGGTGTTTPGIVAGTNITVTGSWPNQTVNSSGGSSTPDSSKATYAETKIVSINTGSTVLHLGDSYTAMNVFPQQIDTIFSFVNNNRAVSGTGVQSSCQQSFIYDTTGKQTAVTLMIGLNELRILGSSAPVREKISGGTMSTVVNHFLSTAVAANNAAVTTSGTWTLVTAGTIGAKSDLSLGGQARTSTVSGSTLTYITPISTNAVVGWWGCDTTQSNNGRFTITVDGTLYSTIITAGKNRYSAGYDLGTSPNVTVINGLANTAHTIVITTLDNKPTPIDYFGTMITKSLGLQPMIVGSIVRLNDSGYRAIVPVDGRIGNGTVDSANRFVLSGLNTLSTFNYPLAYADANKYLNNVLNGSADSVHLNTAGYLSIANSFLEHINMGTYLYAVNNTGISVNSRTFIGTSKSGGTLSIIPAQGFTNGQLILNPQGLYTTVGLPTSTAVSSALTLGGSSPQLELTPSTGSHSFLGSASGSYWALGGNRNPTGNGNQISNTGAATNVIIGNTAHNNGSIDIWTTNTDNALPIHISNISVAGMSLGTIGATATAWLDLKGSTSSSGTASLRIRPGIKPTSGVSGEVSQDTTGSVPHLVITLNDGVTYQLDRQAINCPTIVSKNYISGQTAAATVLTYTTGAADSSYEVSAGLTIDSLTSGSITTNITYTNDKGNSITVSLINMNGLTSTITSAGATAYSPLSEIRAKASTTITVTTTTSVPIGLGYRAFATIIKLHN